MVQTPVNRLIKRQTDQFFKTLLNKLYSDVNGGIFSQLSQERNDVFDEFVANKGT